MTERDWLTSDYPQELLEWLRGNPPLMMRPVPGVHTSTNLPPLVCSDRRLRLFAVAAAELIWNPLAPEAVKANRLAERLADGEVRLTDLPHSPAQWYVLNADPKAAIYRVFYHGRPTVARSRTCADLIRDLIGNPFHPVHLCGEVRLGNVAAPDLHCGKCREIVRWNEGTVPKIARVIYEERAFDQLPALADALEDASCDCAAILEHCRGPDPHAKGCWCVDLMLGRD